MKILYFFFPFPARCSIIAQGKELQKEGLIETMAYNFRKIEKKWQEKWYAEGTFNAKANTDQKKWYGLIEFPYPSGQGLHVGHPRSYTALDIIARKKRMDGYNVLFPIGFDAFGLPAENYAIKNHVHPKITTANNVAHFTSQLKALGFSFDWSREVNTTDPNYYKWTQWIFIQLYKHGLAYKTTMPINFCTGCKVGLANEEVVNGVCERCGSPVVQKEKSQWMLKITDYAERLIQDLDDVDYLEKIKTQQRNWIGKSTGAEINFPIADTDLTLAVYTTRPDTIYGATYMVISPEHAILETLKDRITNSEEVQAYQQQASLKSAFERSELNKDKTGVEIQGIKAINPVTGEKIPIWISDYVLVSYGTGAIMAVPAHDQRDYDFATKFHLPIKQVIAPFYISTDPEDAPREDKPCVKRDTVLVIAKHWAEDKYLCLDWGNFKWHSFVLGGIENGESAEQAAVRELKEETGFTDVKSIEVLPYQMHNYFYAKHKGENRYARYTTVYIELGSNAQVPTDERETKNHQYQWVAEKDISEFINLENNHFAYYMLNHPNEAFTDTNTGVVIGSEIINGLSVAEAKKKIIDYLAEKGYGKEKVNYKLRDCVFSRQRYWGEPIPMVHCEKCGWVPLDEKDLPLVLPDIEDYEPGANGESPLAKQTEWISTTCPHCHGPAQRETDTMPQWAGSSWYFLRYMDPHNTEALASKEALQYWSPIDWYNGGMEHTTLHLLYSRFWHKFLYDIGVVPTKEPYQKRTSHGMILGSNGEKMSKSKGNVVNPDDIVNEFGADTFRVYEMFMGPFDQTAPWSMESIRGCGKFLDRVWNLQDFLVDGDTFSPTFEKAMHKAIKKVSEDIEEMKFNTAVATFMSLTNDFYREKKINRAEFKTFLQLLNPFAPHMTEELFQILGEKDTIANTPWPTYDPTKIIDDVVEVPVQINGKRKTVVQVPLDADEAAVRQIVHADATIVNNLGGKEIVKEIYVKNKIYNLVIR